jgi:hypothetical protein
MWTHNYDTFDDMSLTWQWHGIDMALTWQWHGIDMALTWQWHGIDMALTWQWHGIDMALTWQWHGIDMALTWVTCTFKSIVRKHWMIKCLHVLPSEFVFPIRRFFSPHVPMSRTLEPLVPSWEIMFPWLIITLIVNSWQPHVHSKEHLIPCLVLISKSYGHRDGQGYN